MKIAFGILCDDHTHNMARRLTTEIYARYKTGLANVSLPANITLGPAFKVKDFNQLNEFIEYFTIFSKKVTPHDIHLTKLSLLENIPAICIDVQEQEMLMRLHHQIYKDLKARTGIPEDDAYNFHCTISAGGEPEAFQKIFEQYQDENVKHLFKFSKLAILLCLDDISGIFFVYRAIHIE